MAKTDKNVQAPADIDFSNWTDIQIGFAPYWNPEVGKAIFATVINRDERDPKFVRYLMQAHQDTMCQRGPKENAEPVMVKKGETFSVSVYYSLREEFDLQLESGLSPMIRLEATGKADTKSGHEVWLWRMQTDPETAKQLSTLRNQARQLAAAPKRAALEA